VNFQSVPLVAQFVPALGLVRTIAVRAHHGLGLEGRGHRIVARPELPGIREEDVDEARERIDRQDVQREEHQPAQPLVGRDALVELVDLARQVERAEARARERQEAEQYGQRNPPVP
jgi:hypothetical protein